MNRPYADEKVKPCALDTTTSAKSGLAGHCGHFWPIIAQLQCCARPLCIITNGMEIMNDKNCQDAASSHLSLVRSIWYCIPQLQLTTANEISSVQCAEFRTDIHGRSSSCSCVPGYRIRPRPLILARYNRTTFAAW